MLDGFEVIDATPAGGTFNGSPWRVVLHTTEGDTIDGAVSAYRATGSWPHFTVDPKRRRKVQHYELNVSSRALLHRSGDPETNRANVINIEICGFAAQTAAWSVDWLKWLATDVLTPIRAVCKFALGAPHFVAYPQSYGFGAAQRFSWADWAAFSGLCGHEHVPGNDHGDPGAIDITTILTAIGGTTPAPPSEDFDMLAPCTISNPATGETLTLETRKDGGVWIRNINVAQDWTRLPDRTVDDKPIAFASAPSADFRQPVGGLGAALLITARTADGVTWSCGRNDKGQFERWYSLGGAA